MAKGIKLSLYPVLGQWRVPYRCPSEDGKAIMNHGFFAPRDPREQDGETQSSTNGIWTQFWYIPRLEPFVAETSATRVEGVRRLNLCGN